MCFGDWSPQRQQGLAQYSLACAADSDPFNFDFFG
jgi:hypothetical protein